MIQSLSIKAALLAMLVASNSHVLAQDASRGRHVFRKCTVCHVTDPSATDQIAPPLHNIIGRRAASIPGFDYSEIMRLAGKRGLVWTERALYYFLDRPESFMPGTYMAFSGLNEQERRDVIAYLAVLTRANERFRFRTEKGQKTKQAPAQDPGGKAGKK